MVDYENPTVCRKFAQSLQDSQNTHSTPEYVHHFLRTPYYSFKYLRPTVQSNRVCRKEVKKCVQAGWNVWKKLSGVMCD